MSTEPGYAAPAGWYVDPSDSTRLRWWSGQTWTDHVHPLPEVRQASATVGATAVAPTAGIETHTDGTTVVATRADADADALPADPAPLTRREMRERADDLSAAAALAPVAPRLAEVSDYGWDRESKPATSVQTWSAVPAAEIVQFRNIPSRWGSVSVWLLAFTPWFSLIFLMGAALASSSPDGSLWAPLRLALIPFLLTIGWARRDMGRLRAWGHDAVPHWAWAFLGAPGYLIARTVVLRRHAGVGSAPLWVWGVNVVVAAGSTALLVGWMLSLAVPQLMDGVEQAISADLQADGSAYVIECPPSLTGRTFTCLATDATGTTQPVEVQLDGYDGSFVYSIPGVLPTQS